METRQARETLHSIDEAQFAAARQSQNNGTILLVWGSAVLIVMASLDCSQILAARFFGADVAMIYAPLLASALMMPVLLGAAFWTRRYVRRLPVTVREPGNRWLFVKRSRGGALTYGKGMWVAYHVAVVGIGTALVAASMGALHRHSFPPFAFTIIGLIDAAPLLAVGWAQRQKLRRPGDAL